jgi:hypothetical protein
MNNDLIVTIDENDRAAVTHPMPIFDYAAMRAEQLHALTQTIMGQGFENFSHCNENIQHNVLWLIQSLAEELKPLLYAMHFGNPEALAQQMEAARASMTSDTKPSKSRREESK